MADATPISSALSWSTRCASGVAVTVRSPSAIASRPPRRPATSRSVARRPRTNAPSGPVRRAATTTIAAASNTMMMPPTRMRALRSERAWASASLLGAIDDEAPLAGGDRRVGGEDVAALVERVGAGDDAGAAGLDRGGELGEQLGVLGLRDLGERLPADELLVGRGDQHAGVRGGERVAGLQDPGRRDLPVELAQRDVDAGQPDELAVLVDRRQVRWPSTGPRRRRGRGPSRGWSRGPPCSTGRPAGPGSASATPCRRGGSSTARSRRPWTCP